MKTTKELADITGVKVLSTIEDLKEGFDKCSEYQKDKPITKILQAIESHSLYLIKTTKTLEGYENIMLEDYTSCEFGKWFYSQEAHKELKAYGDEVIAIITDIEEYHKQIHNISIELVKLKKEHRNDEVFEKMTELADTAGKFTKELIKIYSIISAKEIEDSLKG